MRKIESNMVSAIRAGRNWRSSNTEVYYSPLTGVSRVYLHGHLIGEVGRGLLKVSLAGYNTNTTRSRVSALCQAFGRTLGVSNRRGYAHLIGRDGSATAISSRDWVEG